MGFREVGSGVNQDTGKTVKLWMVQKGDLE
jgi:hypothetical protein